MKVTYKTAFYMTMFGVGWQITAVIMLLLRYQDMATAAFIVGFVFVASPVVYDVIWGVGE